MNIHSYEIFPLVFSHILYFRTFEDAHYSQKTFGNRIIPDTHLILLPEIIVTQSRMEVYAEWLVRHGILRRNKVFIDIFRNVPFTWRSLDNYDYMYLVCVAKNYDDMLWDSMKSRFISPRPARLGLLYLFTAGGQCHTCPLMHVPGVLGCCPASRTTLVATRFWVVMICPIIKCLTVLEFSFILFDLCLFITIFNFILNYVPIVTFWIFTYHKIWILLIIFCFIWSYWIIYFLTSLEVFWSVVS